MLDCTAPGARRATTPIVIELRGIERRRGQGAEAFSLMVSAFTLHRGECLAVTGPSGSGKSTLLDVLGLILRPDRAETFRFVTRQDQAFDIAGLWRAGGAATLARLRLSEIGYVLQTGGLLPFLTARQNVELSCRLQAMERDDFVDHLLRRLRIAQLIDKPARALSIGERQRVAIARAFAHRPLLILADEPTAALDPPHALEVTELILELAQEFQIAALIVTHNWDLMRSVGLREVPAALSLEGRRSVTRFEHPERSATAEHRAGPRGR